MTNREQHLKAVMTGRRSRAAGGAWEELLEASCRHYRLKGAAEITKTPEPMKPIGPKNAKGQFLACYTTGKNIPKVAGLQSSFCDTEE